MSRVELTVADEHAGERLDRFLAAVLPGHSRSHIQRPRTSRSTSPTRMPT
jgi:hypothetical protein